MEALKILHEHLVGNFYSRYSVGDTWDLYFENFHLVSQNIKSTDELDLNRDLHGFYIPANKAIDKAYVAKSIIVSSTMRKKILSVSLDKKMALSLKFENGVKLRFPTNTDVVDWQWALTPDGGDPYQELAIVACLWADEIEIGKKK